MTKTTTLFISIAILWISLTIHFSISRVERLTNEQVHTIKTELEIWKTDMPEILNTIQEASAALSELAQSINKIEHKSGLLLNEAEQFRPLLSELNQNINTSHTNIPLWLEASQAIIDKAHHTTIEAGKISENNVNGIIKSILTSPVTAISAIIPKEKNTPKENNNANNQRKKE